MVALTGADRERARAVRQAELEDLLSPLEDATVEALLGVLDRAIARSGFLGASLTAAGDAPVDLTALNTMVSEWAGASKDLMPVYTGMYRNGGLAAFVSATSAESFAAPKLGDVPLVEPVDAVYKMEHASNRVVRLGDDVWENTRTRLATDLMDGADLEARRKTVAEVTGFAEARARTVARTEGMRAYNAGCLAQGQLLGGQWKEWLSSHDMRTRDTHWLADGQQVEAHQPFMVGGFPMKPPGDENAPASETVNCRCSLLWVDPPEGATLPDPGVAPPVIEPEPEVIAPPEPDGVDGIRKARTDWESAYDKAPGRTPNTKMTPGYDKRPGKVGKDLEAKSTDVGRMMDEEIERRLQARGMSMADFTDLPEVASSTQSAIAVRTFEHYREELAKLLPEVRDVGQRKLLDHTFGPRLADFDASTLKGSARKVVDSVVNRFPDDWWGRSRDLWTDGPGKALKIVSDPGRAFYSSHTGTAHFPASSSSLGRAESVLTHELTHRMENANPRIAKLEQIFHARRTRGEREVPLSRLKPGSGYGDHEVTKEDKFANPYMGKTYLGNDYFEVCSMGFQLLLTPQSEAWVLKDWGLRAMGDTDFRHFLLGVLTCA